LLTFLVLAPSTALAQGDAVPLQADPAPGTGADPRSIGIRVLLQEMECAYRNSDMAAAAALIDFPLVVMTGGSGGPALDVSLGPEQWLEGVEPRFNGPPGERATRWSTVVVITESVAWIEDDRAAIAQPSSIEGTQRSVIAVRRHGRWLIKALVGPSWPGSASSPSLARTFG
jgi:hypothetical protein